MQYPAESSTLKRDVPVVVGFDVEPDGLNPPRHERLRWAGFERALEIVGELRPRLQDAFGQPVAFSWFLRMDHQIEEIYGSTEWAVDTYGTNLLALRDSGDELGLHPHALRWDDKRGGWLAAVDDAAWVDDCTRVSFDTYERVLGARCLSHRYGDGFMSDGIVATLRELGARADLTLEPGRPAHEMSSTERPIADQFPVPRAPYRPDPADFTRPSTRPTTGEGLWMLPLTSADPDRALPAWRRVARRIRHRGRPMHRPILLWAPWSSQTIWDVVAADVDSGQLSVLPFMVRVDTLLNPAWAERFEAHLLALPGHALGSRVRLVTSSAAIPAG